MARKEVKDNMFQELEKKYEEKYSKEKTNNEDASHIENIKATEISKSEKVEALPINNKQNEKKKKIIKKDNSSTKPIDLLFEVKDVVIKTPKTIYFDDKTDVAITLIANKTKLKYTNVVTKIINNYLKDNGYLN
jgi:thiol-disulfide isomerase/thioredoxin